MSNTPKSASLPNCQITHPTFSTSVIPSLFFMYDVNCFLLYILIFLSTCTFENVPLSPIILGSMIKPARCGVWHSCMIFPVHVLGVLNSSVGNEPERSRWNVGRKGLWGTEKRLLFGKGAACCCRAGLLLLCCHFFSISHEKPGVWNLGWNSQFLKCSWAVVLKKNAL